MGPGPPRTTDRMSSPLPIRWIFLLLLALNACQNASLRAAKLYLRENNTDRAQEQLELAAQHLPNDPEVHFLLGKLAGEQAQYDDMDAAFQRSWLLHDRFHDQIATLRQRFWAREFNQGVARLHGQQPDYRGASLAFARAITVDPRPLDPWNSLGYAYWMQDSLAAAAEIYAHVLSAVPGDTAALAGLGSVHLQLGDNESAARAWGRLAQVAPENAVARVNRGIALERAGQLVAAERSYREATLLAQDNALAHYNLGNLLWKRGRRSEAGASYQRAFDLDSTDVDTRYNLAVAYISLSRPDEALPLLLGLTHIMPTNGELWTEIGRVYAAQGRHADSRAASARADSLSY
jgi:tetratricopeptide (TPR) repeat protein